MPRTITNNATREFLVVSRHLRPVETRSSHCVWTCLLGFILPGPWAALPTGVVGPGHSGLSLAQAPWGCALGAVKTDTHSTELKGPGPLYQASRDCVAAESKGSGTGFRLTAPKIPKNILGGAGYALLSRNGFGRYGRLSDDD